MKYFYEGQLKSGCLLRVRRLGTEDIPDALALQQSVVEELENKDILAPLSFEEFKNIAGSNGILIGAFTGNRLIAFRALLAPSPDEEGHLGLDAGLDENELPYVIYQEVSNVHPRYRGNRLQQQLAKLIMDQLGQERHPYRYICATVMPFNIPSLKDKLAQGIQIVSLKKKYGERLRYTFFKRLDDVTADEWKETAEVPMDDTASQQKLLNAGWRGFQIEKKNGEYIVLMGK